jgi:hypothetical protein
MERGKQAVIGLNCLVAIVEPMNGAIGQRKMRHVVEEDGGEAMAIEIKRGNCGHGYLYQ